MSLTPCLTDLNVKLNEAHKPAVLKAMILST